jgi:16S rRNA A1518/A1519 N6-dimethyltransferase RsmA/KsgA/DIM1 with predicted DNA glycosylase/AP lyase activity
VTSAIVKIVADRALLSREEFTPHAIKVSEGDSSPHNAFNPGPIIHDREFFHDFLRRVFQQRRKLLRSVLAGMYRSHLQKPAVEAILAECHVSETARAEELDVPALVELANRVHKRIEYC